MRSLLAVSLAAALVGCSGARSKVLNDTGDFGQHRIVGVAPFSDPRGQGRAVADAVEAGLQQRSYAPVDQKALAEVLAVYAPKPGDGLGIEALERIHSKVPVDAIVFGRIAPDWSSAVVTVAETEMGDPILQVELRPRRGQKAFADAADLAREAVRALLAAR